MYMACCENFHNLYHKMPAGPTVRSYVYAFSAVMAMYDIIAVYCGNNGD